MKRLTTVLAAVLGLSMLGVVLAAAVGVPEIDRANATLKLSPGRFSVVQCMGEDAISYITLRGAWVGTETETTPGFTDYDLSGTVAIKRVVWTVNLKTRRGLLLAAISLTDPHGSLSYSGRLTLVTQGVPKKDTLVAGRGWVVARTIVGGVADGGSLLANVELQFDVALAAQGAFGDAAPNFGTPNLSVTTINQSC